MEIISSACLKLSPYLFPPDQFVRKALVEGTKYPHIP